MGDRIQVDGVGLTAKPKGFKRNRPTSRKRIEDFRHIALDFGMQEFVSGGDQLAGGSLYSGLFGFSHFTRCLMNSRQRFRSVSSTVEPSPFLGLNSARLRSALPACETTPGIQDRRGRESTRQRPPPGMCQRTASPPDVEGRDMPVADRLLPSGLLGDFLERQGDLNETLEHDISSTAYPRTCEPANL